MKSQRKKENSEFSRILITLMDEKKITVRKAAEMAGVGASTINSWRSGALPENYKAVKRLANALGVSLSFLLTGEDETRSDQHASVSEVFSEDEVLFNGYAKISIQRLIPRSKKGTA